VNWPPCFGLLRVWKDWRSAALGLRRFLILDLILLEILIMVKWKKWHSYFMMMMMIAVERDVVVYVDVMANCDAVTV
jgi:hypothetical protein